MNIDTWVVTTGRGEEWGCIKRLILDSSTKQICHADVVVADSGDIVRISWDELELQEQGFRLNSARGELDSVGGRSAPGKPTGTFAMDLWP